MPVLTPLPELTLTEPTKFGTFREPQVLQTALQIQQLQCLLSTTVQD